MDASEHPGVNELAPTARRSVGAGVSVNAAQLRRNLQGWPARRWLTAAAVAVATFLVVGIPTDLIDTPLFSRAVPLTPWSVPVLVLTAALTGTLTATYVGRPSGARRSTGRLGAVGSLASFFAVGCPVCNKLVLIALGASGAIRYFAPMQPYLAAASILLLVVALVRRLIFEDSCPVRPGRG